MSYQHWGGSDLQSLTCNFQIKKQNKIKHLKTFKNLVGGKTCPHLTPKVELNVLFIAPLNILLSVNISVFCYRNIHMFD